MSLLSSQRSKPNMYLPLQKLILESFLLQDQVIGIPRYYHTVNVTNRQVNTMGMGLPFCNYYYYCFLGSSCVGSVNDDRSWLENNFGQFSTLASFTDFLTFKEDFKGVSYFAFK